MEQPGGGDRGRRCDWPYRGQESARQRLQSLLNVSYDPTRELYQSINKQFAAKYQAETGAAVNIAQSHGGSSRQSRAR